MLRFSPDCPCCAEIAIGTGVYCWYTEGCEPFRLPNGATKMSPKVYLYFPKQKVEVWRMGYRDYPYFKKDEKKLTEASLEARVDLKQIPNFTQPLPDIKYLSRNWIEDGKLKIKEIEADMLKEDSTSKGLLGYPPVFVYSDEGLSSDVWYKVVYDLYELGKVEKVFYSPTGSLVFSSYYSLNAANFPAQRDPNESQDQYEARLQSYQYQYAGQAYQPLLAECCAPCLIPTTGDLTLKLSEVGSFNGSLDITETRQLFYPMGPKVGDPYVAGVTHIEYERNDVTVKLPHVPGNAFFSRHAADLVLGKYKMRFDGYPSPLDRYPYHCYMEVEAEVHASVTLFCAIFNQFDCTPETSRLNYAISISRQIKITKYIGSTFGGGGGLGGDSVSLVPICDYETPLPPGSWGISYAPYTFEMKYDGNECLYDILGQGYSIPFFTSMWAYGTAGVDCSNISTSFEPTYYDYSGFIVDKGTIAGGIFGIGTGPAPIYGHFSSCNIGIAGSLSYAPPSG